jgi:DNA polymerase-3 subunit delta
LPPGARPSPGVGPRWQDVGVDEKAIFGAVTLVSGPEALLAERAVRALTQRALLDRGEASVTTLEGVGLDASALVQATTGSLFASDAVVVVNPISEVPPELFDTLVGYAKIPQEDLALVLVHPGGVKGKRLLDALKKAKVAVIDCPTIKPWELAGFAVNEARAAGGRIDQGTAARLVEALGADARAVAGAIRQLLDDSDDRVISEAAVRRYFTGRADVTSFTVADHVMAGRRNDALGALRWALDTGVAPVLVTSALATALRQQGRYSDLAGQRMRDGDVARQIGVPPWKVKDLVRHSRDWTPRGLADALTRVAVADAAVKGSAADPAFALERLVLDVAGLRGRRPESSMGR